MRKVGVTGSRKGATDAQLLHLHDMLIRTSCARLVHGDCLGVDLQADNMWREIFNLRVEIFPPLVDTYRAYCAQPGDIVHEPMPYLLRDRRIVDTIAHLLVVPNGPEQDNPRSGTWATYRYAVRQKVPFTVIRADAW